MSEAEFNCHFKINFNCLAALRTASLRFSRFASGLAGFDFLLSPFVAIQPLRDWQDKIPCEGALYALVRCDVPRGKAMHAQFF